MRPPWPEGYGHHAMDCVTSTLDEAAQRAAQSALPTWFTARVQTRSRGRRGRAWVAPEGNFYASLSLPELDPARAALRSFVSALALRDALAAVCERADISLTLKWPNDVLLNDGKVAGILLESLSGPKGPWGVAIGIGVNLVAAPDAALVEPEALRPVSVRGEAGISISAQDFLPHLAEAFARREAQFNRQGFAAIRTAWLAHAAKRGEQIRVRLPNKTLDGLFKDIDPHGQLILATPAGDVAIAAGDVFFGE